MKITLRTGVFKYVIKTYEVDEKDFYSFIMSIKEKYDCYNGIILYWDSDGFNVVVYDDYWE